jgi:hypothetical protein
MGSVNMDIVYALAAYSAPLIGFVVWLTPFSLTAGAGGWDFPKYFMLGLYMAAVGFLMPLLLWLVLAPQSAARAEALSAARFHGVILGIAATAFAGALAAGAFVDKPNPTLNNPPSFFLTAMTVLFVGSGFLLPLVEIGWMLSGILRVLQGPRIAD